MRMVLGTVVRKVTASLVFFMILTSVYTVALPSATADETVPPTHPVVERQSVVDAVLKGLDWFAERQFADGAWANSVGVTGLVLLCYAGAGFDHTNQTVSRGLAFLRNFYDEDEGFIARSYLNYETAIALMVMSSFRDPQDEERIGKMTDFMVDLQFGEGKGQNITADWYYGGWPNYADIPDMSNFQFAILGLHFAQLYNPDVTIPDEVWQEAIGFAHNCQNWPDVNDLEWAHNTTLPSYGDGGFVYNGNRSRTPAGEQVFESYGSITAAGLFSYLVAGKDPRQPEVRAAREWLDFHYNLEVNPNMVGKGLYYYLWSQTRALAMSPQDWVVDGSGKLHDWRAEIATRFMDLQRPDGGWDGNPQAGWREDEMELASMYAIMCLEYAYMMAPGHSLTIEVTGADTVGFVTSQGEILSTDATRGITVTGSTLTCTDPETFRKVWLDIGGTKGATCIVTCTGTWAGNRQSRLAEEVELGEDGARVFAAAGGFAGPFGLSMVVLDRGPVLEVADGSALELEVGTTTIAELSLSEATGEGPVAGVHLSTHLRDDVVADVEGQGQTVTAGGEGTITLTITVPEGASLGDAGYILVTSDTASPVVVPVSYVEAVEDGLDLVYIYAMIVIIVAVLAFIALPVAGRRRGS